MRVDIDALDKLAPTQAGHATKLCRPTDASRSQTMLGRPEQDANGHWTMNACTYCLHRPRPPPECASVEHPQNWWYGTGDGMHPPQACQAFKRYLAEGGDVKKQPEYATHLQGCLMFRNRQSNRK